MGAPAARAAAATFAQVAAQHEGATQPATVAGHLQRAPAVGIERVHAGTTRQVQLAHLVVAEGLRVVQRGLTPFLASGRAVVHGVHVSTAIEQPGGRLEVAITGGQVQQRPTVQSHPQRVGSRVSAADSDGSIFIASQRKLPFVARPGIGLIWIAGTGFWLSFRAPKLWRGG